MKKKVLIVFKYPRGNWNPAIINKFSIFYDTKHLYVSNYKNKNFDETIEDINNIVKSENIEIVVFDVDYFKFINFFFIEKIKSNKKILITGDDFELHDINAITASACDLVLSHCPLSVLKYREKGFESYIIDFEKGKIAEKDNVKKDIDVLFFGALSSDRSKILNYLKNEGIKIENVGHVEGESGLPEEELLKLITRSKIVLNLSKSRSNSVKKHNSENIYKYYYQFKGRIIMAGLNGAACVSEYSPGQELLFNDKEVPTFFTKEECAKILKDLLSNNQSLLECTSKFTSKVCDIHEDKKSFKIISNAIDKSENRKVELLKIPYWYLRIAAKQIIIRNIKLPNIIKTIKQSKIIFLILKDANIYTKLLIIFEAILNILWYSIILTLRPKK